MINSVISAVLQIIAFTLIPLIVYLIKKKQIKGFLDYIGIKKSTKKANLQAILVALIFLVPILFFAFVNDSFMELLTDPNSVTGMFREMGFGVSTVIMIFVTAILKTALAEEILFRGFIAKRLIAVTNYRTGNLIQAILFGILHLLLFLSISQNITLLFIIFLFPTIAAYLSVYLNEKVANGSIIPGWIAHASANLISYSVIGFLV